MKDNIIKKFAVMSFRSRRGGILPFIALMFLLLCGVNLWASGLNFGPVQAVNNKVSEYNDKMKQKAIANGTASSYFGSIQGKVTTVTGLPSQYISVSLDGNLYSYTDASGNYVCNNVTRGTHVVAATNSYSQVITSTVTVASNAVTVANLVFDWATLGSTLNGNYYFDSRLTAANSPYTVTGNVTIYNLFIEPGVVIKFTGYNSFYVYASSIIANGTSSNPIKFTSGRTSPAAGDYSNVTLFGDDVQLNYVTFEYGSSPDIYGDDANSVAKNCTFSSNNSAFAILNTNGVVKYCNFQGSVDIIGAPSISYCNIAREILSGSSAGQYSVNHCNLTQSAATVVNNNANWTLDLTNNWWGTLHATDIAGYITSTAGTINYTPYLTSTVSTAGPQ